MRKVTRILIISSDRNLREVLSFCFDGWGYEVLLKDVSGQDISPIKRLSPDVIVIDVHSASKSDLEICRLLKDDFTTAFIPIITLINKRQLREQLLNIKQGVDDYLIKPPDPLDLRIRIEMAIKRSQYSFYSSPLTGLPGGRIIEEVLQDRIKKNAFFSFGYADIDNFKYFNDVYGYVMGDRVIMHTAYILYTAIRKVGLSEDFIGHVGGDDFVFITRPERYQAICRAFMHAFDTLIPFHYSEKDRRQGYIVAKDRTHTIKKIPLMSVSIAVVNRIAAGEIKNLIELNEKVAEIKRYLKNLSGSKFMAERRDAGGEGTLQGPQTCEQVKGGAEDPPYKPLGQILLEQNLISSEQLDEALIVHWKRGMMLGEILQELGFLKEDDLKLALLSQENKVPSGRKPFKAIAAP